MCERNICKHNHEIPFARKNKKFFTFLLNKVLFYREIKKNYKEICNKKCQKVLMSSTSETVGKRFYFHTILFKFLWDLHLSEFYVCIIHLEILCTKIKDLFRARWNIILYTYMYFLEFSDSFKKDMQWHCINILY